MSELEKYLETYSNNEEMNDKFYLDFTYKTDTIAYLKDHRNYIEKHKLGFGDRAFSYMWYIILKHLKNKGRTIDCLEIGVFKGQVISLWSFIAKKEAIPVHIHAITPLKGNPRKGRLLNAIIRNISPSYKKDLQSGNHYENENYAQIIEDLFKAFDLNFNQINVLRGFSTDPTVLDKCKGNTYDVIYIDGDHKYEGVVKDIKNFSGKLRPGGFLVMDDASCNVPGTAFWKGHQSVSDACVTIDTNIFKNVLNIGHNRVYQRL